MSTETIFICYSNKDAKFANDLANTLIKAGANIWIESLHGQDDDDAIEAAIKSAKLVLIVTSENALTDETLKQEKTSPEPIMWIDYLLKLIPAILLVKCVGNRYQKSIFQVISQKR